jgi:hypothetical protein
MTDVADAVVSGPITDEERFKDAASMDAWMKQAEADLDAKFHGRAVKEVVKEQEEQKPVVQAAKSNDGSMEFALGDNDEIVDVSDAADAILNADEDDDFVDDEGNIVDAKKAILDKLSPGARKAVEKLVNARLRAAQQAQGVAQQYQTATDLARGYKERAEQEARSAAEAKRQNMVGIGAFIQMREEKATQELAVAKAAVTRAHEEGNSAELADAQVALQEAILNIREMKTWRDDYERDLGEFTKAQEKPQQVTPVQVAPQQRQAQADQARLEADDKVRTNAWLAANSSWYGTNAEKTGYATYVHQKLTENGVSAITHPDTYWSYMDQGISMMEKQATEAAAVKARAAGQQKQNTTPRVSSAAPAAAANARGGEKQTVKLGSEAIRFAKELGIDPKAYALETAKWQREQAAKAR